MASEVHPFLKKMITVNGEPQDIRAGETLQELLEARGYRIGIIAVEYNGLILKKEDYAATVLQPGDKLEVVSFVGGG